MGFSGADPGFCKVGGRGGGEGFDVRAEGYAALEISENYRPRNPYSRASIASHLSSQDSVKKLI